MRAITFAAAITLALSLAACFTPKVTPQVSQAVLDARARRDVAAPACDGSARGPVSAGFGFGDATATPVMRSVLDDAARWLTCHPQAVAVLKGASDNHGTSAEQAALAQRRVEAVASYLAGRGVPAGRVRRLAPSEAEPAGEHLLILAEGQRW